MITILLVLLASLLAAFAAGMRCAVVLRQGREQRRGGMIDLTGIRNL